ncbi:MAG: hypothetical protein IT295_08015, partial [Dehalococcoidia bacterium]|nr:hypothetical protein [Dehalococcoidia bacterium]
PYRVVSAPDAAFRYDHRSDAEPMCRVLKGWVTKTRHGRYGHYAPVGHDA